MLWLCDNQGDLHQRIEHLAVLIQFVCHCNWKHFPEYGNQELLPSSVFHLNDSHLHLMVHWAGQGSSIVFCLARDQVEVVQTTRKLYMHDMNGNSICWLILGNQWKLNLASVHLNWLWDDLQRHQRVVHLERGHWSQQQHHQEVGHHQQVLPPPLKQLLLCLHWHPAQVGTHTD